MPYVKSIPVRSTVNKTLNYILNPDKTEGLLYTSSMNCMTLPRDAYLEMKAVYENYSTERFDAPPPLKGKGSVKAIHYIQSFDPKDNISPELAHRIAKAFARKTFGDDCQVIIATHTDRGHIHSHLLVNTYTLTGRKLNDNQKTLKHIKEYSDRVCRAFGIQPFDKSQGKGKTVSYHEWDNRRHGTSWKQKLQTDIDNLIVSVKNLDELLYELEICGYEVKKGKYISLKAPGQQRFIRSKTLGEDYTAESLASRILWHDAGNGAALTDEPSPLRECYQAVIGQVMQLASENRKVQRLHDLSAPYSSQNDLDVHRLSAQLTIITSDRIHSIGELEGKIEALHASYEKARQELNVLIVEQEKMTTLIQQAETFFALSEKATLSDLEQVQLTFSRQAMLNHSIKSVSDLADMKSLLPDMKHRVMMLKEQLKTDRQLCNMYTDIAKTYHEISKGDYISRLIADDEKHKMKQLRSKNNSL